MSQIKSGVDTKTKSMQLDPCVGCERSVYKSAKSFFSQSILKIAQLRYQILIFLEMNQDYACCYRCFEELKNETLEWNRNG